MHIIFHFRTKWRCKLSGHLLFYVHDFGVRVMPCPQTRPAVCSILEHFVALIPAVTWLFSVFLRGQPVLTWDISFAQPLPENTTILIKTEPQSLNVTACVRYRSNFTQRTVDSEPIKLFLTLDESVETPVETGHWRSQRPLRAVFVSSNAPVVLHDTYLPKSPHMSVDPATGMRSYQECFTETVTIQGQLTSGGDRAIKPLVLTLHVSRPPPQTEGNGRFCPTCWVSSPDTPQSQSIEVPFAYCMPDDVHCRHYVTVRVDGEER